MRNNLFRKGLVFIILVLFVGVSIVSGINIQLKNTTIANSSGRGNTLNVGSSGSGLVAHWDFNDTQSSDEQNPIHAYSEVGNFTVTLTVTDSEDNTVSDTTWALIWEHLPIPPPEIKGPTSGKPGISYEFSFFSTTPDGEDLSYYIDWDDGDITDWTTYSGSPYIESHTWSSKGAYTIKAKAKDIYGTESGWSELEVLITKTRAVVFNSWFLRFLQQFPILHRLLSLMRV